MIMVCVWLFMMDNYDKPMVFGVPNFDPQPNGFTTRPEGLATEPMAFSLPEALELDLLVGKNTCRYAASNVGY